MSGAKYQNQRHMCRASGGRWSVTPLFLFLGTFSVFRVIIRYVHAHFRWFGIRFQNFLVRVEVGLGLDERSEKCSVMPYYKQSQIDIYYVSLYHVFKNPKQFRAIGRALRSPQALAFETITNFDAFEWGWVGHCLVVYCELSSRWDGTDYD
jgi:hypothetical protein